MPRNRAKSVRNGLALLSELHSVLASAILSDARFRAYAYAYAMLTDFFQVSPQLLCVCPR